MGEATDLHVICTLKTPYIRVSSGYFKWGVRRIAVVKKITLRYVEWIMRVLVMAMLVLVVAGCARDELSHAKTTLNTSAIAASATPPQFFSLRAQH